MSAWRAMVAALVVSAAVVLQVTVFPHFSWQGIVPNLGLLVVVGAALVRGPQFACLLGFATGLLVDLAPPADHIAGRWALAFVVVGYLAGRIRQESPDQGRPTPTAVVLAVAASSFVASSVYALTGLLLGDPSMGIGEVVSTILIALIWDVLLTPFVLPVVMLVFARLQPSRVAY